MTDKIQPSQHKVRPAYNVIMAVLTLGLVLALVNITILKYEKHLASGKQVLLALAPVDPRGFMQGDYMTLNFAIANDIRHALKRRYEADAGYWLMNNEGVVVVRLDDHGVGQFVRVIMRDEADSDKVEKINSDEMRLTFKVRQGRIKFATNAFFFQEGHAGAYEAAEYGVFAVNQSGNPLLKQMADKQYRIIQPDDTSM